MYVSKFRIAIQGFFDLTANDSEVSQHPRIWFDMQRLFMMAPISIWVQGPQASEEDDVDIQIVFPGREDHGPVLTGSTFLTLLIQLAGECQHAYYFYDGDEMLSQTHS
jgi:hypothetical protein